MVISQCLLKKFFSKKCWSWKAKNALYSNDEIIKGIINFRKFDQYNKKLSDLFTRKCSVIQRKHEFSRSSKFKRYNETFAKTFLRNFLNFIYRNWKLVKFKNRRFLSGTVCLCLLLHFVLVNPFFLY